MARTYPALTGRECLLCVDESFVPILGGLLGQLEQAEAWDVPSYPDGYQWVVALQEELAMSCNLGQSIADLSVLLAHASGLTDATTTERIAQILPSTGARIEEIETQNLDPDGVLFSGVRRWASQQDILDMQGTVPAGWLGFSERPVTLSDVYTAVTTENQQDGLSDAFDTWDLIFDAIDAGGDVADILDLIRGAATTVVEGTAGAAIAVSGFLNAAALGVISWQLTNMQSTQVLERIDNHQLRDDIRSLVQAVQGQQNPTENVVDLLSSSDNWLSRIDPSIYEILLALRGVSPQSDNILQALRGDTPQVDNLLRAIRGNFPASLTSDDGSIFGALGILMDPRDLPLVNNFNLATLAKWITTAQYSTDPNLADVYQRLNILISDNVESGHTNLEELKQSLGTLASIRTDLANIIAGIDDITAGISGVRGDLLFMDPCACVGDSDTPVDETPSNEPKGSLMTRRCDRTHYLLYCLDRYIFLDLLDETSPATNQYPSVNLVRIKYNLRLNIVNPSGVDYILPFTNATQLRAYWILLVEADTQPDLQADLWAHWIAAYHDYVCALFTANSAERAAQTWAQVASTASSDVVRDFMIALMPATVLNLYFDNQLPSSDAALDGYEQEFINSGLVPFGDCSNCVATPRCETYTSSFDSTTWTGATFKVIDWSQGGKATAQGLTLATTYNGESADSNRAIWITTNLNGWWVRRIAGPGSTCRLYVKFTRPDLPNGPELIFGDNWYEITTDTEYTSFWIDQGTGTPGQFTIELCPPGQGPQPV